MSERSARRFPTEPLVRPHTLRWAEQAFIQDLPVGTREVGELY
jgi:hypothetical protein